MDTHDVVVLGASAGGLDALKAILARLPADMPAALFVVVHTAAESAGFLWEVLGKAGPLRAQRAEDRSRIEYGRIYVAGPDRHLLLAPGIVRVARGPRENGFRPAVDPLFRSAARAYGARVVGVVLSGGLDDGTLGLALIKQHGGIAVAQDPEDALIPSMPLSAIRNVSVDHILPAQEIGSLLARLARTPIPKGAETMADDHGQPDEAELGPDALRTGELTGPPSPFTCPECGGALWETSRGQLLGFRCHVGHGFTAETLVSEQKGALEDALWTALRALEEHAALQRRMCGRAREAGLDAIADRYEANARDSEVRATAIRKVLLPPDPRTETAAKQAE